MGILSWAERHPGLAGLSILVLTIAAGAALGFAKEIDPRVALTWKEIDGITSFNNLPPVPHP